MGIIKEIVTEALSGAIQGTVSDVAEKVVDGAVAVGKAAGKVANAVGSAFDKTFGDAETRHYFKEQKYIATKKDKKCLFVQRSKSARGFTVFDVNEVVKYFVDVRKARLVDGVIIQLFDNNRNQIGIIQPQATAKNLVFKRRFELEYTIELKTGKTLPLKNMFLPMEEGFVVDPYNWFTMCKRMGKEYSLMDNEEEIAHINKRSGYETDTFILDYSTGLNEHEILLIGMAIIELKCNK